MILTNNPKDGLRRRYVYDKTYQKITEWAKENKIKTPNHKENFPFLLQEYINNLEYKMTKMEGILKK